MRLPEFVIEKLKLKDVLEPLLTHLRSIMIVGKKVPELRTHNIVFVPVGSHEQVTESNISSNFLTSQFLNFSILRFFDFLVTCCQVAIELPASANSFSFFFNILPVAAAGNAGMMIISHGRL